MWDLSGPVRVQIFSVPCIGRQTLSHWTTREVRVSSFWKWWSSSGIYSKETFSLRQMTYYLEIPDGLWILEKDQHHWKNIQDQRHFQEPMFPSVCHLLLFYHACLFAENGGCRVRKLPTDNSELESSWSQTLKFFFRKTLWASVICPWQKKA